MTRQQLGAGEILQLIPPSGGVASDGIVESVEGSRIRVRVTAGHFGPGQALRVQHVVPEDARYTVDALIEEVAPPTVLFRTLGTWSRVQQREYVRLRLEAKVYADVHADPAGSGALPTLREPLDVKARVVDLSAGGLQLETNMAMGMGMRLFIRFELPGGEPVATTGLVVRRGRPVRDGHRVGLRFVNLAPALETVILRFIYAQQAEKRRRTIT